MNRPVRKEFDILFNNQNMRFMTHRKKQKRLFLLTGGAIKILIKGLNF